MLLTHYMNYLIYLSTLGGKMLKMLKWLRFYVREHLSALVMTREWEKGLFFRWGRAFAGNALTGSPGIVQDPTRGYQVHVLPRGRRLIDVLGDVAGT